MAEELIRKQLNIALEPGNRKKLEAIRFYTNKSFKKIINDWISENYDTLKKKYGDGIYEEKK